MALLILTVTTTALFIYMMTQLRKMRLNLEHSIKLLKSINSMV